MNRFYYFIPYILQNIIWIPTKIFFKFFLHIKIIGFENIKHLKKSGIIFASNHTSELDPIILPSSLPFLSSFLPIFYTSREKDFYKRSGWRQNFYGGWFFKIWGAHQLNPGKKNYHLSLSTHIEILKNNKNLCIFPEGKRSIDGNLSPARGGIAYLSEYTGKPIVPIAINGLFGLTIKDILLRRRRVSINFLRPIYWEEINNNLKLTSENDLYKSGAQYILDEISKNLQS